MNRKCHILPWKTLPRICLGHHGHFHFCFWSLSRDVTSRPGDSATPQEAGGSQGTASRVLLGPLLLFQGPERRSPALRNKFHQEEAPGKPGLDAHSCHSSSSPTQPLLQDSRTVCYLIPGLGSVLLCTYSQPPFEFPSLCRGLAGGSIFSPWC